MASIFCLLSFLSWGKQTWMMSILKALWPFPESLFCKVRWRRVPLGVRKSRLAVVPALCHATEKQLSIWSTSICLCFLFAVPLFVSPGVTCINPRLTKVPSVFSTSITLNSVQENCSFLSLDSLPIAVMTTCAIHPSLNWFCFILCKLPSWFLPLVYFHIATVCVALLMRISLIFKEWDAF